MEKDKFNTIKKGNSLQIALSGHIDEDTLFSKIDLIGCNDIIVDWKEVKTINSCGIREWIRWPEKLPSQLKIVFLNCPRVIVNQIDMIKGFLPLGAKVHSFYVPYYCESCEHMTSILFSQGKEYSGETVNAPKTITCEKCKGPTEMDVINSKYFRFLRNT